MQLYRWRARSMAGKLYQGSYLADSKQEVAAFLHENYDYITGIEEVQSFTVKISRLFNSGKVNDKERSRFFQQLAAMIGSGRRRAPARASGQHWFLIGMNSKS